MAPNTFENVSVRKGYDKGQSTRMMKWFPSLGLGGSTVDLRYTWVSILGVCMSTSRLAQAWASTVDIHMAT